MIGKVMFLAIAAWQPLNPLKCKLDKGVTASEASATRCSFDPTALRFSGTPAEQARCLTQHVGVGAKIGGPELPASLSALVGQPIPFSIDRLAAYLRTLGLIDSNIGGSLSKLVTADYFIIHDTSWPNCSQLNARHEKLNDCDALDKFPSDRDSAKWRDNQTFGGRPKQAPNREANAYTNRVGGSVTEVDFADSFFTTKFEQCENGGVAIGHFVGVENIQPRLPSTVPPPSRVKMNDANGPNPGFTDAQYDRLGLLYLVASARRGQWLIPAYHAVIDSYYSNKHDDPQNFDIAKFVAAVGTHLDALK